MEQYKCLVLDLKGKKLEQVQEGESRLSVAQALTQKGYTVLSVELYNSSKVIKVDKSFTKVKNRDLAVFCRQMQAMLKAGVSVTSCLEIMRQQLDNKKLKSAVVQVNEDLHKGRTFSEALKKQDKVFPEIFIHMIEAGEISGNLDLIMDRLATHFEKEYKIESKVKTAMAYPLILVIISVVVVVFLLTSVMPTFIGMYSDAGVTLPLITRIFIGMSNFIVHKWYILLAIVIICTIVVKMLLEKEETRILWDQFILNAPIFKQINRNVATSRFTRTLSTLLGSGVSLLKALDIIAKVTGNKYIEKKIRVVREDVKKGTTLSSPLQRAGIFPPMVYSMIKIGEDSGTLEEILETTANFYDEEVDNSVQRLTIVLEPLMIVVMAVMVGFIVLAMVLPMFDMASIVG